MMTFTDIEALSKVPGLDITMKVLLFFVVGFTIMQFCYMLILTVLMNKERNSWQKERMELQSRVQAGTAENYLRTKLTLDQLEEGKKQADHERAIEKKRSGTSGHQDEAGELE